LFKSSESEVFAERKAISLIDKKISFESRVSCQNNLCQETQTETNIKISSLSEFKYEIVEKNHQEKEIKQQLTNVVEEIDKMKN
jgi:uncharacterized protein YqfB (UPF0267 family)